MTSTLVFGLFLGLFIATCVLRIVPKGQVFIKSRLGRDVGSLHPGIHFLIPFIETTTRQSTGLQKSEFQIEKIKVSVTHEVKDALLLQQNVADFSSALKVGSESRLRKHLNDNLNVSLMDLANIESEFKRDLVDLFAPWGVVIHEVKLANS